MFSKLNKTSSFTKWLTPDELVPTIEAAKSAGDDLVRRARPVRGGSFTWVRPEKHPEFKLVGVSPRFMKDLELQEGYEKTDEFQNIVSGQEIVDDVYPWAQAYAGWQFGEWAGQLGDGRAISLFELTNSRGKRYELQLKGAGLTPFSRFADGKAVVRSSVREMLGSEAVNALGIPTTRALSLVRLPQTKARRHLSEECAIVCRGAETWIRVGTFDLHRARGNRQEMRKLADYCIQQVFGGIDSSDPERYIKLYREICLANARGLAQWQSYGLLNGVINTDNTSIYGLFIDYGPFAFMDTFDSSFTPNHDDGLLRYSYKNTPTAVWWNLVRLGEDLGELLGAGPELVDDEKFIKEGLTKDQVDGVLARAEKAIKDVESDFKAEFIRVYTETMTKRLGLRTVKDTDHDDLLSSLLEMMEQCQLDYNRFFRLLGDYDFADPNVELFLPKQRDFAPNLTVDECKQQLSEWLSKFQARCRDEDLDNSARQQQSRQVNPKFVLRTWILNEVIQSVQKGETAMFDGIMHMALNPFNESWGVFSPEEEERLTGEVPRAERAIQCSCSS